MKKILLCCLIILSLAVFTQADVPVTQERKCPAGLVGCTQEDFSVENTKITILKISENILGFAGIIAVLMLVIAGIRLIVAAGNQENLQNVRKQIIWTILGLILIILAFLIIKNIIDLSYTSLETAP